jgi:hypothetical protein
VRIYRGPVLVLVAVGADVIGSHVADRLAADDVIHLWPVAP